MNTIILISAIICLFCAMGHLVMGIKMFLKPMLNAKFDEVPKRVMYGVFHYITVNFILSTIVLFAAAVKTEWFEKLESLVLFIGVQFILYCIVLLILGVTSGIKGWPAKMFQWLIFLVIGITSLLGLFL